MGFIGVFAYVCIVYLAQTHPITLFPSSPQIATLLLSYKKYKLFYKYVFKSRSPNLFIYMFHTVCSNITVGTELGLLCNIDQSCYFAQIPMSAVKFSSRSCLNGFSFAEIGQWVVCVLKRCV